MADATVYTTGGTVQAGGGLYLTRQADDELLARCREGSFAFVLTARQMGKSSLMTRTAERLIEEGVRTVIIDLNALGTKLSADQWYLGLLVEMERQLGLKTRAGDWWRQRTHLGITHRMSLFFEDVLLVEVKDRLVVFVDEIDSTLSLDFTDDFFASIRSLYNGRAQRPDLARLSFVLLGVATPGDLIKDAALTPFNLGHRVELTDFTFEEARPLVAGLGLPEEQGGQVLRWAMEWTGGHPYLTQRLCREISQEQALSSREGVEHVVAHVFLGEKRFEDNNLQFVRDMLTKEERAPDVGDVLRTYRQIWRGRRVPNEEQSRVKSHLKLSGVVRREGNALVLRNRIYREVLNDRWISACMPFSLRRFAVRAALPLALPPMLLGVLLYLTALVIQAERDRARVREEIEWLRAQYKEESSRLQEQQQRINAVSQENAELHGAVLSQTEKAKAAIIKSISAEKSRQEALDQIDALQRSYEEQLARERSRQERHVAEHDAARRQALKDAEETRQELLRVREELERSTGRAERAHSLLQGAYKTLAFPGDPNIAITDITDKPGLVYAFIEAPPGRDLFIESCGSAGEYDVYRLNDMASNAMAGPAKARRAAMVASALALTGGAGAVADAARGNAALYLLQGTPGAYLVYYIAGVPNLGSGYQVADLIKLRKSGQTLDLKNVSKHRPEPRCPPEGEGRGP